MRSGASPPGLSMAPCSVCILLSSLLQDFVQTCGCRLKNECCDRGMVGFGKVVPHASLGTPQGRFVCSEASTERQSEARSI